MTNRVGPKGQVVLPKRIRDRLGIKPGDSVVVDERDDEVRIRRVDLDADLFGSLPEADLDPLAELEAEHRWELGLEEKRIEEWRLRRVRGR
jgi:AbrB family looped-hinge helix DNA binding protein